MSGTLKLHIRRHKHTRMITEIFGMQWKVKHAFSFYAVLTAVKILDVSLYEAIRL